MRFVVEHDDRVHPPQLRLYIHYAPHRRAHPAVLAEYKVKLRRAILGAGLRLPIRHPIDLTVTFIAPTSPDLGNLYLALEQALDGKMDGDDGILADDGLIHRVEMQKLFYVGPDFLRVDKTITVP